MVWHSCLAPQSAVRTEELVQLAGQTVAARPDNYFSVRSWGAALYRAGRYAEAVKKFQRASELHPSGGEPVDFAFLAMAQFRCGDLQSARRALACGQQKLSSLQGAPRRYENESLGGPSWSVRMEASLLISEAAALVEGLKE